MKRSLTLMRMNLKIFTVDAFTSIPFEGNPAAVVPLNQDLPETTMQNIASEMNLSETAFVRPTSGTNWISGNTFSLRWFTPTTEVALCGHATLATAHTIFYILGNQSSALEFDTQSGILTARRKDSGIVLDFPSNPPVHINHARINKFKELIEAAVGTKKVKEILISEPTKKLLIRLDDYYTKSDLEWLDPNSQELQGSHDGSEVKGVIVTLRGNLDGKGPGSRGVEEYDFISRYFAPWNGIPEDPVTGSAHTVLGPYWSNYYGFKELKCRQCSPRGGDLQLTVRDDGRIDIYGKGTTVVQGELSL